MYSIVHSTQTNLMSISNILKDVRNCFPQVEGLIDRQHKGCRSFMNKTAQWANLTTLYSLLYTAVYIDRTEP